MKPRLAESANELMDSILKKTLEYRGWGSVVIEVFGLGRFSFNSRGQLERVWEIQDKSMYWGSIPVCQLATPKQIDEIKSSVAADQCDIVMVPYSRHHDPKLLHSCSGLGFSERKFT